MPKLSLAKLERHLYSAADRLRQEGLDAATYKDYIFGLLFLKRCSDVFDAEREKIVGRKLEQGMAKETAELQYGENSNFYDTFFVPERARWHYLQSKLADASESYGSVLDKALGALSEHNESLEHVLDHISFMRVQSSKMIESWSALDVEQQNNEMFLAKLQQLESGLMSDFLTGRVRVPENLDLTEVRR
jgi:type I restriction enzyme M protein